MDWTQKTFLPFPKVGCFLVHEFWKTTCSLELSVLKKFARLIVLHVVFCMCIFIYTYICVCVRVRVCKFVLFRVYIDFTFSLLGHPQNADENLPGIPSNTCLFWYTYPRLDLLYYLVMIFLYVFIYVYFCVYNILA